MAIVWEQFLYIFDMVWPYKHEYCLARAAERSVALSSTQKYVVKVLCNEQDYNLYQRVERNECSLDSFSFQEHAVWFHYFRKYEGKFPV